MRVLFLGEIVGRGGVYAVRHGLPELKKALDIDYVIANGDGAVNGSGLGRDYTLYLRKLGINLLTCGDAGYSRKDFVENIASFQHVIRPANYPIHAPGKGLKFFSIEGRRYLCINVLGQAWQNRNATNDVLTTLERILHSLKDPMQGIFVDMHSLSTAEKQTLMYAMAGKITALFGTGQRVQTNDLHILQEHTATITDAGLCGTQSGIIGMEADSFFKNFLTGIPQLHKAAFRDLALQGVWIEVSDDGRCVQADYVSHAVPIQEKDKGSANTSKRK